MGTHLNHTHFLSDTHESILHVTLGHIDSALDVYKALRRSTGLSAPPTYISIVDSPQLGGGAMKMPPTRPTAAAVHCIGASPVDEQPSSPPAATSILALDAVESEPGASSLSPVALTFSSEDGASDDEVVVSPGLTSETYSLSEVTHSSANNAAQAPRKELFFDDIDDDGDDDFASPAAKEGACWTTHGSVGRPPSPTITVTPPTRPLTLTDLPAELLVAVLGWLEGDVIARVCTAVCKQWWQVAGQSDALWRTVCTRRFPRHSADRCGVSSHKWCQLFKDEWLWMCHTTGSPNASATSDQRSRYSIEVVNATERPMSLNS